MKKTYLATAVAALFATPITTAIAADTLLDDVVVSSSRSEQRSFDAPGSIQSVNRAQIENGGPQINLSESLVGIPGINAANRNNYAQDLQISIRGFGARAPFGVRGVKMYVDGLPASLADGQGQTSQFALTSADRIEVLKGPISSLYGNASGGVLQVFTRNPSDKPELIIADTIGSYGLNHKNIQYSEKRGDVGVVIDSSNFKSDGFRDYSSVEREHLNAKLIIETERGKVGILANYLDNKFAQEPGSRTLSEYQSDPYGAVSDNKNRGYGKSFTQGIYGLTFDGKLDNDNFYGYRVYTGDRKLNNPGGTLFVIDRKIMGGAVNISTKTNIGSVPVKMTSGLEYDQMKDYRLGYSWVDGAATWDSSYSRREDNLARSYGGFLQSEWLISDQYTGLLGLRYTNVKLEVEDFYPVNLSAVPPNPNSSGEKRFQGISPVAGLTYHLNQNSNIYLQIGRGFETPTLNEVLYTTTNAGSTNKFDYGVTSAKTMQSEFGYKWRNQNLSRFDIAIFHARTSNDIVPYAIRSIGSTWTNADTSKFGLEISVAKLVTENLIFRGAFTAIEAKYDQSTYSYAGALVTSAGNKVPGIPTHQIYADLAWRSHSWLSKPKVTYSEFGIDLRSTGKINVDSRNSYTIDSTTISNANMITTSSYYLIGAKASHSYKRGPHNLTFFGRLDNMFDKKHVGSVVVNQESGKYYEPGMPRNWILGVKYSLAMN